MKRKAWLLEPPRFDLSWLYKHYDVRFVIPDKDDARASVNDPEKLWARIYKWAGLDFDTENDLFVLTGNVTMLVVAVLAIQEAWPEDWIGLLRYDTETSTYTEIRNEKIERALHDNRDTKSRT